MNDFASYAAGILRTEGFRLTGPRLQTIQMLANSTKPITHGQIFQQLLSTNNAREKKTITRVLDDLRGAGLIVEVFGGYLANPFGKDALLIATRSAHVGTVTLREMPEAWKHDIMPDRGKGRLISAITSVEID